MGGSYRLFDKSPAYDDVDVPRAKGARAKTRDVTGLRQSQSFIHPGSHEWVTWESWSSEQVRFEARPGQINEYTISLPDELISIVRARLKDLSTAP